MGRWMQMGKERDNPELRQSLESTGRAEAHLVLQLAWSKSNYDTDQLQDHGELGSRLYLQPSNTFPAAQTNSTRTHGGCR
jgi:hypothetical protein